MTSPRIYARALGGSALSAAVVAAMLIAPPGATAAEEAPVAAAASDQTAIVTDPTGSSGPKLTPGPSVSQKQVQRRNSEQYAGARPMWVQQPILQRKRGKYRIFSSATVAPHRGRAKFRKHTDTLSITATVLRKGQSSLRNPQTAAYHKRVVIGPKRNGLVTARMPISKAAAKKVKALQTQRARIVLTMVHSKDTFPKLGTTPDLHQQVRGEMTKKMLSKRQVKRRTAANLRVQRRIEAGKRAFAGGTVQAQNLNQLYRRKLVISNNTPFTQHVVVNPNIACMFVNGISPSEQYYTQDLTPGVGSVTFFLANGGGYTGIQQWAGSYAGNPPADGGGSQVNEMADAGREILRTMLDTLWEPEFYSKKGLISAAVGIGVSTIVDLALAGIRNSNECNFFGQYWSVNATAMHVGSASTPNTIVGTPKDWATGSFVSTDKEGKLKSTSAEIGVPATHPDTLPAAGSPEMAALQSILNSAVGQQSTVTYFDNAGMSAPLAKDHWNGLASFSQGLVQYLYPNIPSCEKNDCNNGTTAVQLGYLVDGYDDVVGPKLLQKPEVDATKVVDPVTLQTGVQLQCTIRNNGNFSNPFGGTQGAPGPAPAKELNSLAGTAGVDTADFAVTYYAQDAAGNYLYNKDSVSSAFPGPVVASPGAPPPNLKPNTDGNQLVGMNVTVPTALNLSATDLASLVNPSTGRAAAAVKFGCAVIPAVTWKNMDVTSGSVWGGNWPFPQVQSGGWLSSPVPNDFNNPNKVLALNVTWLGDTYLSDPVASPQYQAPKPISVSPTTGPVTGDTNVTISGQAFVPGATVTIGGVPCTSPVVVDSETITCVTGAVSAAHVRGDVRVTNPLSADVGTGKDLFTFTAEVTGVSPTSGDKNGGTPLTISGVGFGRDSTVMVGSKSCRNPVVVSTTKITCTTPAHPEGAVDVAVTNPRPLSTSTQSGAYSYIYVAPPALQINSVFGSPTTAGGREITIYGPQLNGSETVTVGGRACTNVRHWGTDGTADNYISCAAPAQPAAGQYDVVVSRSGYAPATVVNGLTYT